MDRPPTPAGPLFLTRTPVTKQKLSVTRHNEKQRTVELKIHDIGSPGGNRKQLPFRDVTNKIIKPRPTDNGEKYRDGRAEIPDGILPAVKGSLDRRNPERPILRNLTGTIQAESDLKRQRSSLVNSAKKSVKFLTADHTVVASIPKPSQREPSSCQVTGTPLGRENTTQDLIASRPIRVVKRVQNPINNTFSMFRRKLQNNLNSKFSSENTALTEDCVIRRFDSNVNSQLKPNAIQQNHTLQSGRIERQSRQSSLHTKEIHADVRSSFRKENSLLEQERRISRGLAEKAEEYFTRNLRYTKEDAPRPNVIKTYVVEGNPAEILAKMDSMPPVSLTTRNLEIHDSWWTSVDSKESLNRRINPRENRIRHWVEDIQSTSRLNRMRVVNIVVKDKGINGPSSRDDHLDRMSQTTSQIMA